MPINFLKLTIHQNHTKIWTLPRAYIYTRVEESLYNRLFIVHYKSVAYQAVSTTLSKGCSSGFVHWFPVWYFLQPSIFTLVPKHRVWGGGGGGVGGGQVVA